MSKSFSKSEISQILNKASQIQASIDHMGDAQGLSEEELYELGKEVGLSKQALLEAISEVENIHQLEKPFNWISGSSQLQFDQQLLGELSEETKEAIIAEIQTVTGGIGKVATNKATKLEWEQRRSEIGYKHITFTEDPQGHIRFRYNYNWAGLKLLLSVVPPVLSMAFLVIIGKGMGFNEWKGLFVLVGLSLGFMGSRIYLKSYFEQQKAKFHELKKGLSKILKTNQPKVLNKAEKSSVNQSLFDQLADESDNEAPENPSSGKTRTKS